MSRMGEESGKAGRFPIGSADRFFFEWDTCSYMWERDRSCPLSHYIEYLRGTDHYTEHYGLPDGRALDFSYTEAELAQSGDFGERRKAFMESKCADCRHARLLWVIYPGEAYGRKLRKALDTGRWKDND